MFGIRSRKSKALETWELALKQKEQALVAKSAQFDSTNILAQQLFYQLQLYKTSGVFDYDLKTQVREGYIENPHVYKVINKIIGPAKNVPFLTYIVKDKKDFNRYKAFVREGRVEEAELFARKSLELVDGTPMNKMAEDAPNEMESWPEFIEAALGYMLLTGNRFIYGLQPAGYKFFTKIYNLPAQITEIIPGEWREPVKGYRVHLTPTYIDAFPAETVLHQKTWNPSYNGVMNLPKDYLYGLSPMHPLCKVVRRSNESLTASWHLLKNGFPPGIVSSDSETPLLESEVTEMQEAWIQRFGGGTKANIPLFTGGNVKYSAMGLSSADMELLDADQADLKSIATVYQVPLPLVSDDKSTYNNVSEAKKELWMAAIVPALISFRDGFNRFVTKPYNDFTGKEYWCDFDLKAVPALQDDLETKSTRLMSEMEHGIWTANEVRRMMDQEEDPSDPNMNKRMLKSGLRFTDEPLQNNMNNPGKPNNEEDENNKGS